MPKISAGSLEEHRAETTDRLLDAWSSLVREKGYDGVTLAEVAAHVGLARTAIYNYFPDRDALVTALIIDAYTSFGDWQLEARDSLSTAKPRKKLEAIGLAYRNWAHTDPQRASRKLLVKEVKYSL